MKKFPTIFLSYNPDSDIEETLAIRLHTIGAVHGFQMLLPDRHFKSTAISNETKNRIAVSNYFIVFSTKTISKIVKTEIEYAFERIKDKSKIIIILDKKNVKKPLSIANCTEITIDSQNHPIESILNQIIGQLKLAQNKLKANKKQPVQQDESNDVLAGIILAGLSLLILGALFSNKK